MEIVGEGGGGSGEERRARRKETLKLSTGHRLELREEVTPVLVSDPGSEEGRKAPGWRSVGTGIPEVADLGQST